MRLLLILLLWTFAVAAHAQDVRISEFLASNVVGQVRDNQGDASPWIELWNPSPTSKISLNGWRLKYGETEWVFPAVDILPDQHMIVWASGKDQRVVTAPLHTNFVLGKEGSYLALLRPVSASVQVASEFAPAYPVQQDDVSYGRDAAVPSLTGYYVEPTPEDPNSYSGVGVASKVVFSEQSKAYTGTLQVTLSLADADPETVIRYTTNGTVPRIIADINETITTGSTLYTGPITVSATQIIRARAFKTGVLPGETGTEAFLLLDANSATFSSTTPLVAVTNFGRGTPPADSDQAAYMWVWEPGADGRSRMTDPPSIASRIAIDLRGSSTLGNPKFNLNVEARNSQDEEDFDIPLLGMPEHSDWVFHAPYDFDRSLVHNPFIYALSNQIGRYAPRSKMAEVFVDTDGGSLTRSTNYFGVYNVMEKIRRNSERVDIERLDTYDNGAVEKTGGYIVKVDRRDPGDNGFSTPRQGSFAYYQPREIELLTPQRDPQEQYIKSFLTRFDNSMYQFPLTDAVSGYRKYLDVPAAIDHHLLNLWPMNVDALRLSGYMHKDRDKVINGTQVESKLVYGPIWDFDRAMESTDDRDNIPTTWRGTGDATDFFNYTWWNRLFSDIEFYQAYIDQWQNLRRGAFSRANVEALLDSLNNEIGAEAVNRDLARWGRAKRTWTSPYTGQSYTGQTAEIQRIKDWMQQRANFFDTQWVGPVTFSPANGHVDMGGTVAMSGPAGVPIYYTTDGSDPRPVGGGAPTTAVLYTGPITITATTQIRARAYKANHTAITGANSPPLVSKWSGVTDARFAVEAPASAGALLITELNYHPADPTAVELAVDPDFSDSDFEFLEFKNVSDVAVDLGGLTFTSGIQFSFTGRNAISLQPGEMAILTSNPSAFAARYGARPNVLGPFGSDLSNAGERLLLVDSAGQTLIDFTYDDGWYPSTDGKGRTLVVYHQKAPIAEASTGGYYRESAAAGGTPGSEEPPFVTTLAATEVGGTSVRLSAVVSANDSAATLDFLVSGTRYTAPVVPAGSPPTTVELAISGLSPHTTYTYFAEATSAAGVGVGAERTFTTSNNPPLTQDQVLHVASLSPFAISIIASDADGDALTITSVTQAATGEVTTDGSQLFYAPAQGYDGNASFSYTVSDGFGGTASGTITLQNTAPVGGADQVVTGGAAITFNPLVNDSDADGDALAVVDVTQGSAGSVAFTAEGITYTPGPGFFGTDTFTYSVSDGVVAVSVAVTVQTTAPLAVVGAMVGSQVPGEIPGTVYASLGLPTGGLSFGQVRIGSSLQSAIFAADGSVLLKVGNPAPGIPGAVIQSLKEPSGHAVIAKLSGVPKSANIALYVDLDKGQPRVGARKGASMPGGGTLKNITAVDGNGTAVFFRTILSGVPKSRSQAVGVVPEGGEARLLVRTGDLVNGQQVRGIATLIGAAGTLAEGRWRSGADELGVQLKFKPNSEMLYTIPASAASSADWTLWGRTGDTLPGGLVVQKFGFPGFAPDGVAAAAQVGSRASDVALLRTTVDGSIVLVRSGSAVPGADGNLLPTFSFKKISSPVAGTNRSTAFGAKISGPGVPAETGLWYAAEGEPLRMLARSGQPAPGGGVWTGFDSLVLPDGSSSGPVFTATLATSGNKKKQKSNRALYALNGAGEVVLLIGPGQTLNVNGGTRQVAAVQALDATKGSIGAARGHDSEGRVSALVTFTDGVQALVDIAIH